ncbi:uncharacterized protein LOC127793457 [Diospyros lotus]|uniref:uncharacterized protein LOC127793457 n=1 Tax=Diospyros lotus TaxID=55363 RepID=UPI00225BBDFA|nr:uncharacterized protein LOC127793457 [Diospyros lotus]
MAELLGFEDENEELRRSGLSAPDFSPDSVIFASDSNSSFFSSSASCSADRCSFASSDVLDHDSELSQSLAGHDQRETSSGPDSDPNKFSTVHRHSRLSRKVEKGKVQKGESNAEIDDKSETVDSARNSFSQALKEFQERKSRSEALLRKPDRQRPASLDLNNNIINVTNSSPRFVVMKKNSAFNDRTGTSPSPGTPNYQHVVVGTLKSLNSEHLLMQTTGNRRHVSSCLPLNNTKALPSKWEDAERWIFSPVSSNSAVRPSFQQPQRRPKSKSGPLGPPGVAYYSSYSPAVPVFEGGKVGNLMAQSPFSAGVIAADGLSIHSGAGSYGAGIYPERAEPCMGRSVSVHGCPEMLSQSSLRGSKDEKLDGVKDAGINISHAVSRKDMATQMSPQGSPNASPGRRSSLSPSSPLVLPLVEMKSVQSSRSEIRDVQVDERVTMTRWSKKHRVRLPGKGSESVDDWKKKAVEARSFAWEVSGAAKSISKIKREEAKITAWENLQKSKAEAAIRKLEMKLEKRRSSSMDKIMSKLRSAQKKAQEMRSSLLTHQSHQITRTSYKVISLRRTCQMNSLSGCFTCHAF